MTAPHRFPLGQLLTTPAALDALRDAGLTPLALLARHAAGDWGDLGPEDSHLNERALRGGGRLFSAYDFAGSKVWIITEADRAATTVLLPDDY